MQFCSRKNGLGRIPADVWEMHRGLSFRVVRSTQPETFPSLPGAKPRRVNLGQAGRDVASTQGTRGIGRLHPQHEAPRAWTFLSTWGSAGWIFVTREMTPETVLSSRSLHSQETCSSWWRWSGVSMGSPGDEREAPPHVWFWESLRW